MATSLLTLKQNCAKRLGWYGDATPSAASQATTTWVSNAAGSGWDEADENSLLQDLWAYVEADSAGTPLNVGEVRRVKDYGASTGTFTLATGRGFTDNPTTTQTISLWKSVPPEQAGTKLGWKEQINRVLRSLRYRRLGLLGLVTDGDMETSGTTSWTASNATLTKTTTAASVSLNAYSLRVQNSAANGYARSTLVPVGVGEPYEVRADVKVASGTAYLVAYDETNAAEIDSRYSEEADWRYLAFSFNVPATCRSLSIRLKGSEATADAYWDNVSLRHQQGHRLPLPSWIDKPAALEGLREWRGGTGLLNSYLAVGQQAELLPHADIIEDPTGATKWLVEYIFRPRHDSLLLVQGLALYGELATDSATTEADKDLIASGACYLALRDLNDARKAEALSEFGSRSRNLPRVDRPMRGVY